MLAICLGDRFGYQILFRGTPQGGVISPLLANLYLHYALDNWLERTYPSVPFERYADDAVVHCRTQKQAVVIRNALQQRLAECGLELHPDKTRIVYCKQSGRDQDYDLISFDFLGFCFRPRKTELFAKVGDGENR